MMRRILLLAGAALAMAAPAVAAPGAHPDFTGVWQITDHSPAMKTVDGKTPPLRPEAKAVYDQHKAMAAKGDRSFDLAAICIPEGMPRLMTVNKPFEMLQRDKAIYFVHQNRLPHRAYFGEAAPVDPELLYLGYSTAKWDGQVLVVETTGFRDVTILDDDGLPHSDAMKLTERYSLGKDGKSMDVRFTIDDPKTFTQSWSSVAHYAKRTGFQMPEEVCAESLKSTAPKR